MKPGKTGLQRIFDAAGYSWKGLKAAFKHEAAFRQELFLCMLLTPLAFYLGNSAIEYVLMLGSLVIVLLVEILNSAIEAVVDRTGDEYHEFSGRAKDMGSAAVLISLLNVALVWGILLAGRLW